VSCSSEVYIIQGSNASGVSAWYCLLILPRAVPGNPHGLRLQRLRAEYRAAGIHKSCRELAIESGAVNAVEIGRDVLAVARYLQGQPYVKASQFTAVGWSLGAGAVLAALGQMTAAENSPLRAVVALARSPRARLSGL
jgi:hypothetical protein